MAEPLLRGELINPELLLMIFKVWRGRVAILARGCWRAGLLGNRVMMPEDLELVENYADILQIGARNMQNYSLLKKLGASKTYFIETRLSSKNWGITDGGWIYFAYEIPILFFVNEIHLKPWPEIRWTSTILVKELTHCRLIGASHGTGKSW